MMCDPAATCGHGADRPTATGAQAHGMIGKRFFPATLAIDDPFVADELSLPTISHQVRGDGRVAARVSRHTISGEFSKRLSPDFGFSLGGDLTRSSTRPGTSRPASTTWRSR